MMEFEQGVSSLPGSVPDTERADVRAWMNRISEAREFDKGARKRYAIDRRYARGDSGFEVSLPIAGSYIDILKAFLYARDPDLDCQPSEGTQPPPIGEIMLRAREAVQSDPMVQQQAAMAAQSAADKAQQQAVVGAITPIVSGQGAPQPPPDIGQIAQDAQASVIDQAAKAEADRLMTPYRERSSEAKQLGQTLEAIISRVWTQARLKAAAEKQVASGLTIAAGWLKACWQERTGEDPLVRQQISDLQDNIARIQATQQQIEEAAGEQQDALLADLQRQIDGLGAQVEVVIARGMAIDFVSGEDIQIATGVASIIDYRDSPWIAHRTFMSSEDAKATFPSIADKIKNASPYYQQKPADPTERRDSGGLADVDARDADTYKTGAGAGAGCGSVCVWEVWDRTSNQVLTLIEGLDCYARTPYAPNPGTSRFYPFFLYSPIQVDGERHPQSLIQRSQSLLDDMNRLYSNRAEHRRRCIPKLAFDATLYEPAELKKLEAGGAGEMVPIKPARPGESVANALHSVAYPPIDPALYDDGPTRAMLEMTWGIQEALSSSIRTAKTATEAEIQQTGTNARTGYMRDCLDSMLSDLAEYTAEVCLQKMSREDAVRIAGPWAFWPEGISIEDLGALVVVQIRAGSSGKPDTTRQREAWAAAMPVIQNAIMQVGQLRGSSPESIADCIEELVAETLQRTGDKIDPTRFLPDAPVTGAIQPPMSGMPAGQQGEMTL